MDKLSYAFYLLDQWLTARCSTNADEIIAVIEPRFFWFKFRVWPHLEFQAVSRLARESRLFRDRPGWRRSISVRTQFPPRKALGAPGSPRAVIAGCRRWPRL